MDTISYRTDFPNAQEVQHDWVVIDATDQVLGRLCAKVAKLLRGTYKPSGQRELTPEVLMQKSFNKHIKPGIHPLFMRVMKGMLPKNRLGRRLIENMHVYNGPNHPHEAQNPTVIDINKLK